MCVAASANERSASNTSSSSMGPATSPQQSNALLAFAAPSGSKRNGSSPLVQQRLTGFSNSTQHAAAAKLLERLHPFPPDTQSKYS